MPEETVNEVGTKSVPIDPTDVSYTSILQEHDVARSQRQTRRALLLDLGKKDFNDGHSPSGVVAHLSKASLSMDDIPILGNVLRKIGDVHTLNLILHSPGGDGTVVEKFVALCRTQCTHFRVMIPHLAKSAATLIALGADEILMGPPSELGPIDAQVPVVSGGVRRYISAQAFIDARDDLLKRHKDLVSKKEDTTAILQMLASLDVAFVSHCEHLMDFGRDVARKLLSEFMFKNSREKDKKIDYLVKELASVDRFKVHGRVVDGNTARREFGLKVKICGHDDPCWKKIWEYYTRADITLSSSRATKLFETSHELLMASPQD